jgi:hypothetical protein
VQQQKSPGFAALYPGYVLGFDFQTAHQRHCEEQRDEAIQLSQLPQESWIASLRSQ